VWAWSRHPNYWGEVELWWGMALITLIPSQPLSWLGFIAPAFITYSILKVSGIPMLEKQWEGNAAYEEYKQRVNAFVPWFPRKRK
jgi:steroid 5-alpha reductase family enzyme